MNPLNTLSQNKKLLIHQRILSARVPRYHRDHGGAEQADRSHRCPRQRIGHRDEPRSAQDRRAHSRLLPRSVAHPRGILRHTRDAPVLADAGGSSARLPISEQGARILRLIELPERRVDSDLPEEARHGPRRRVSLLKDDEQRQTGRGTFLSARKLLISRAI